MMSTRVARALVLHELMERLRDRWVLVGAGLFVLLASGVGLYGRGAEASAASVTAPSLVTLATFLVPLVALILGHDAIVGERERNTLGLLLSLPVGRGEVLFAKALGRLLALALAVVLGLGAAGLFLPAGQRATLLSLAPSTLLLGAAFLSLGVFISSVSRRHATAASLAVAVWFVMVLFWDLGLLAVLVATDGALSQDTVAALVMANPAGLYRLSLLLELTGASDLASLGLTVALPTAVGRGLIWTAWILGPLVLGALVLGRRKAVL
jgi:Cu-processing system permease protein